MDDDEQALRCPSCGSEEDFKIAAIVWVTVAGADMLDIVSEDGDREYGSEDACRCDNCGHQARLGNFHKEDQ